MGPDRRLRLFIYARIIISFLFLVSTILLTYKGPESFSDYFHSGIVRLMFFSFVFSVFSNVAFNEERFRFFVTYLQSIWDVLFVTLLLLFTGGILSPYSFLYLLSIMNAGVLLGRREALYTAALCSILYGAMIDFQYFGMLESIGLSKFDANQMGETNLLYNICLNILSFGATALITGYLSERARMSEVALQIKSINFDELVQLNSMIVSNIETGLLTTNSEGKVRVFNPHAEALTGISQETAYNKSIHTIFPELGFQIENVSDMIRGEFDFISNDGIRMEFGYSVVPLEFSQSGTASVIFNFRDITAIRRMEAALKRADRLAAVGELSARMAHEIRNPLAAMSGSVQMLAEHGSLGEGDARLLNIVLRESARLNSLITDFLAYARPTSPNKEIMNLRDLVEDTRILLSSSSNFSSIEIINKVSPVLKLMADPNQFKQVFLNLLSNATEAMPKGGSIVIDAYNTNSGKIGKRTLPLTIITITDNGNGVDSDSLKHLFEPFWTTKTSGTGLGLAIVYRIVESHGGTIEIESVPQGGCRVVIQLPA